MTFTATPTDVNGLPMSSAVPDGTNTPLPIEGGPSVVTGGNTLTPVSLYVKDGNDVAKGLTTDTAWSGSGAGTEIALLKKIIAGQSGVTGVSAALAAFVDGAIFALGSTTDAAVTAPGTNATLIAFIRGILTQLQYGQKTMAGSIPVAIASDQTLSAKLTTSSGGGVGNTFHLVSAANNNAATIKGTAGQVYSYQIFNAAASTRYVKLFNKATTPVPGTDTPRRTIGIAAGASVFVSFASGLTFNTGIGISIVTGIADLDNTAGAAADVVVDIDWV